MCANTAEVTSLNVNLLCALTATPLLPIGAECVTAVSVFLFTGLKCSVLSGDMGWVKKSRKK